MNVNFKEKFRVESKHVEQIVEEGGDDGHPHVNHDEEKHHLQGTPERLQ